MCGLNAPKPVIKPVGPPRQVLIDLMMTFDLTCVFTFSRGEYVFSSLLFVPHQVDQRIVGNKRVTGLAVS